MKKLLTNKNFIQKAFISIIIVLLFSFSVPVKSQASVGGMLLDPLVDLIGTLFDVVTAGLQKFLVNGEFGEGEDGGIRNAFMVSKDSIPDELKASSSDVVNEENKIDASELDSDYYIPNMKYTPDKIFANKIPALDINFINPKSDWEDGGNNYSIAYQLHNTIASWYVSLRNLTIVGLLLVLLYIGIRIIISSTASDKSKYKQMLVDWVVALCLAFTLHYVMTFTVTIVSEISNSISSATDASGNGIVVQVSDGTNFKTDLMGLIRFKMQYNTVGPKLLHLILYIAMVCYTCIFTFKYLKRVLIIAFLTLISPLVALTYPIDKIRDGKAQAFDLWFKEYIFNALEQPFHLIIYTIFVSTSVDLVSVNPLIAIVALAFIMPAEKILRKFFGFNKAETSGALGTFASAVGGTAAYNMLARAMSGKGGKGGRNASNGQKNNNSIRNNNRIKDPDAPSGVDGFTGLPLNGANSDHSNQETTQDTPEQSNSNGEENTSEQLNAQQRMVDAYDENNFGTEDYDPAEREAMAREAYQPSETSDLSRDEFLEQMKNYGFTDEEAEQLAREQYDGEQQPNAQTRMVDAYDENNFGTEDYDSAEREALAREAYQPSATSGLSRNEFLERMKNSGFTDEEAEQLATEQYGAVQPQIPIHQMHEQMEQAREANNNSANDVLENNDLANNASENNNSANNNSANASEQNAEPEVGRFKAGAQGAKNAIKNRMSATVGNKHWRRSVGQSALRAGGHLALGAVHVGGRVVAGATIGAVGLGMGIAGDDLGDIIKYGVGGTTLGATVGGKALNNFIDGTGRTISRAASGIANSAPVQGFREGFTGRTSTQRRLDRQIEESVSNPEFVQNVQQEYRPNGRELQGRELIQAAERAAQFQNYGIKDPSDLGKTLKLEDSIMTDLSTSNLDNEAKERLARQQATTATKLAKQIQDPTKLTDAQYVKDLTDSYERTIRKKNPGLSQRDARENAEKIMKRVKQFHKID